MSMLQRQSDTITVMLANVNLDRLTVSELVHDI